jgi:hypothetical protein
MGSKDVCAHMVMAALLILVKDGSNARVHQQVTE